jgi:hypothetical protein
MLRNIILLSLFLGFSFVSQAKSGFQTISDMTFQEAVSGKQSLTQSLLDNGTFQNKTEIQKAMNTSDPRVARLKAYESRIVELDYANKNQPLNQAKYQVKRFFTRTANNIKTTPTANKIRSFIDKLPVSEAKVDAYRQERIDLYKSLKASGKYSNASEISKAVSNMAVNDADIVKLRHLNQDIQKARYEVKMSKLPSVSESSRFSNRWNDVNTEIQELKGLKTYARKTGLSQSDLTNIKLYEKRAYLSQAEIKLQHEMLTDKSFKSVQEINKAVQNGHTDTRIKSLQEIRSSLDTLKTKMDPSVSNRQGILKRQYRDYVEANKISTKVSKAANSTKQWVADKYQNAKTTVGAKASSTSKFVFEKTSSAANAAKQWTSAKVQSAKATVSAKASSASKYVVEQGTAAAKAANTGIANATKAASVKVNQVAKAGYESVKTGVKSGGTYLKAKGIAAAKVLDTGIANATKAASVKVNQVAKATYQNATTAGKAAVSSVSNASTQYGRQAYDIVSSKGTMPSWLRGTNTASSSTVNYKAAVNTQSSSLGNYKPTVSNTSATASNSTAAKAASFTKAAAPTNSAANTTVTAKATVSAKPAVTAKPTVTVKATSAAAPKASAPTANAGASAATAAPKGNPIQGTINETIVNPAKQLASKIDTTSLGKMVSSAKSAGNKFVDKFLGGKGNAETGKSGYEVRRDSVVKAIDTKLQKINTELAKPDISAKKAGKLNSLKQSLETEKGKATQDTTASGAKSYIRDGLHFAVVSAGVQGVLNIVDQVTSDGEVNIGKAFEFVGTPQFLLGTSGAFVGGVLVQKALTTGIGKVAMASITNLIPGGPIVKSIVSMLPYTFGAMVGSDLLTGNLGQRPVGDMVISGVGSTIGMAIGSALFPGIGSVVGGVLGGMAADWINKLRNGESEEQAAVELLYEPHWLEFSDKSWNQMDSSDLQVAMDGGQMVSMQEYETAQSSIDVSGISDPSQLAALKEKAYQDYTSSVQNDGPDSAAAQEAYQRYREVTEQIEALRAQQ